MKKLIIKDFKAFIMRGNVLDMAVGVIIGAAFGKIVTSFVTDILMPPIGLALGHVDFSHLYINLSRTDYPSFTEAKKAGAATINYGLFINTLIDFMIVAFAVFLLIQVVQKLIQKAEMVNTKTCPHCISHIPLEATKCAFCTSQL